MTNVQKINLAIRSARRRPNGTITRAPYDDTQRAMNAVRPIIQGMDRELRKRNKTIKELHDELRKLKEKHRYSDAPPWGR